MDELPVSGVVLRSIYKYTNQQQQRSCFDQSHVSMRIYRQSRGATMSSSLCTISHHVPLSRASERSSATIHHSALRTMKTPSCVQMSSERECEQRAQGDGCELQAESRRNLSRLLPFFRNERSGSTGSVSNGFHVSLAFVVVPKEVSSKASGRRDGPSQQQSFSNKLECNT